MGKNVKEQVDALLALDEPPELAGMPRGLEEHGALRKAIEASIKYWNAWREAQLTLIEIEDAEDIIRAGGRARRNLELWRSLAIIAMAGHVIVPLLFRWFG